MLAKEEGDKEFEKGDVEIMGEISNKSNLVKRTCK